ncbi:MAG: hypothetical protein WDN25_03765 [Acetobacteraceae bacterium]
MPENPPRPMAIRDDGDELELGPCCICEREDGVRNLVMLERRCAMPGRGWSCFTCGLPAEGASAVLCDGCAGEWDAGRAALRFACRGHPASDGRVPICELEEGSFRHDQAKHLADTMAAIGGEAAGDVQGIGWLDPVAAWRALAPAEQERIGAGAIAHRIGCHGSTASAMRVDAAWFMAADVETAAIIDEVIGERVLKVDAPLPRPRLASLGIRQCRACGCTDQVGCPEGCCWVEDDLCSRCKPGWLARAA